MMATGAARRPLRHPVTLLVLAVAELMLTLDLSIVNVALPAMRGALGFAGSSLEWVVNGYALAFGGVLLLGGRVADLLGGRRVFLGALSAFATASLACALAAGPATLVAARVVQGLSAGVLSPATLSLLTATYRSSDERNRALSIWTAVAIGGGAVGAVLGGLLTGAVSWRWIFLINVPVGASLVALGAAHIPRTRPDRPRRRLDVAGAVTITAALSTLVWALVRTGRAGWGSPEVIAALATAGLLLAAFIVVESRLARAPLVPLSVFRSRLLAAGNLLSFLSFVPVTATWFFLTLYLQQVRGHGAIAAGLLFLPMSLAVVAGSQAGFGLVARVDARALFAAGGLLAAAGLTWLGRLSATTAIAWVIAPGSLAMVGGGLMFAPITVAATTGATAERGGLASGLLTTTRQLGGAVGLAVLGTIAAGGADAGRPAAGYAHAFTVGAGVFAITALLGACVLPRRLGARAPADDGHRVWRPWPTARTTSRRTPATRGSSSG